MERKQRHGNKRQSGVFEQPVPGLQRRTSKTSSSNDRQGHIPAGSPIEKAMGPDTSAVGGGDLASALTKSSAASSRPTAPSSLVPERSSSKQHERKQSEKQPVEQEKFPIAATTASIPTVNESGSRPRTRTMEEQVRERSPTTILRSRTRLGSINALPSMSSHSPDGSSSIGFPSIDPSSRQFPRQRLIKPLPHPISPGREHPNSTSPKLPSPSPDTNKILQLMKTTCGRMHGILYFRAANSRTWSSGYCAINVATSSLIYQMKGETSHAKVLISDLRGCRVRTQIEKEVNYHFIEIAARASGSGIHLRPHVPETFDSWLAALLCWQPLRPKSMHDQAGRAQSPAPGERRPADRRRNSSIHLPKNPAIIKVGKMLYWDHSTSTTSIPMSPSRRVSTYKQLRAAASIPWRKISCTLQEDGQLKLYVESNTLLFQVVPLSLLSRCAVQRLHPTVLDDEYCLAIYPQYYIGDQVLDIKRPIYLSLESRVLFEVWFVLLRAFTIPELYGPEQASLRASVDLTAQKGEIPSPNVESMFRISRYLAVRIIEAKFHSPKDQIAFETAKKEGMSSSNSDWIEGDYHAEVMLDGDIRGRTMIKSGTSNPFWREDYEFNDLPPSLAVARILLKARTPGQNNWTLVSDNRLEYEDGDLDSLGKAGNVQVSPLDTVVGTVDMPLNGRERRIDCERWWPIKNESDEIVGELLMKLRTDEAVVLSSQDYKPLSELLHSFSNGLTQEIATVCASESRRLHETLLNIFQVSGQACSWIMSLVEDEIDGLQREIPMPKYRYSRRIASNDSYDSGIEREMFLRDMGRAATAQAHLLFRGNSLLTKALDFHMRRLGKEYLDETLGERVRDIDESNPDCEVDPNRVKNPEDLQRNWRNLIALTENVWRAIASSASRCPAELRTILRHVRSCAEDRYGDFLRSVCYSSVSGFLFLRFFCPAVLNPKLFGLLKDYPRPRGMRTLTLIAKSLQTLANMTNFGNKEPWMEPMNSFLNSRRQEFKNFVDQICSISSDRTAQSIPPSYATPITILSRLPQSSKEGFLSLPYLIDQTCEFATLVCTWVEASPKDTTNSQFSLQRGAGDAISIFHRLCHDLRGKTRDILKRAEQAKRSTGLLDVEWEDLVARMDRPLRPSEHIAYQHQRTPRSLHERALGHSARPTTASSGRESSLSVDDEAPPLPTRQHQLRLTSSQSVRSEMSMSSSGSSVALPGASSGVWAPSTDRGSTEAQLPAHALSWDDDNDMEDLRDPEERLFVQPDDDEEDDDDDDDDDDEDDEDDEAANDRAGETDGRDTGDEIGPISDTNSVRPAGNALRRIAIQRGTPTNTEDDEIQQLLRRQQQQAQQQQHQLQLQHQPEHQRQRQHPRLNINKQQQHQSSQKGSPQSPSSPRDAVGRRIVDVWGFRKKGRGAGGSSSSVTPPRAGEKVKNRT